MKYAVLVLVLLIALIGAGFVLFPPGPERTATTDAPPIGGAFSLNDDGGKPVTEQDFRGRYALVFFGFTNCPDVCPTTLMTITELMEQVDPKGERITPLFISVDTGDEPEAMRDYLTNFHPSIVGLTGNAEQIKQVAEAYKVYYARVPQPDTSLGYTMDHSSFLFFMAPDGRYIRHFGYQDPMEKITTEITSEMEKRR